MIMVTGNYGQKYFQKIIDEQFDDGWLMKYSEDMKDYWNLKYEVEETVHATREWGGRKAECVVAAAIREVSERRGRPVHLQKLADKMGVTEVSIRNNKVNIKKILETTY